MMLEINLPEVLAEVMDVFGRYERALVDNDVQVLDAMFWKSGFTLRYGIAENLYGYDAIAEFRATRPPIDMTRDLLRTVITSYGRNVASANVEFQRKGASLTGRQSQTWIRTDEGWVIAAAHVSLMQLPR